jgi:quinol monooxygenase YgiN
VFFAVIVVVATVKLVEGKGKEYEQEYHKIAPKVRKDPGVITYVLNRHAKNPNQFLWYEKYESEEAFKYHISSQGYKDFQKNTQRFVLSAAIDLYQEIV